MKHNDILLLTLLTAFAVLAIANLLFNQPKKVAKTIDPLNCNQAYLYDGKGNPVANLNSSPMCCK
jgi:hypothetical protein